MTNFKIQIEKIFYQRILKPIIFNSRVGRKAMFGRAGGGLFVDYIYKNRASGYNWLGYLIDKILLHLPSAKATKEKMPRITNIIQSEIIKNTLTNEITKIVDLGSGTSRYLIELSKDKKKNQLQALCLDIDKNSLRQGKIIAKDRPIEYRIGNITRLGHYKKLANKISWHPNIAIIASCYEFLDDGAVRRSLEEIYNMLEPGGLLIVSTQMTNPNKKLFEYLAVMKNGSKWHINYRRPSIIKKWIIEAGFKNVNIEIDRWEIYFYCVARKTGIRFNKLITKPIFSQCASYIRVSKSRSRNAYHYMRGYEIKEKNNKIIIEGKNVIMLASNDYFGLTTRPEMMKAGIAALKQYGSSTASSRLVRGNLELHEELEGKLAEFLNMEDALVFSTGYMANVGTISALIGENDIALIDRSAHASILDGSKLSKGEARFFVHNSMEDLEKLLHQHDSKKGKLIVCDGVYSMDGDLAPLKEICNLAEEYRAAVAIDDGHGTGVFGENGRGVAEHLKVEDKVDIILGSLGKAFGSVGGFAASNHSVIEYLRHNARSFIFSTSLNPIDASMALAALTIIKNEPHLRQRLWENTYMMKEGLQKLGFNTGITASPIIPVIIGDEDKTFKIVQELEKLSVVADPIIFPAVKKDKCRIRVRVTATHSKSEIEEVLSKFKKVGKDFGVI